MHCQHEAEPIICTLRTYRNIQSRIASIVHKKQKKDNCKWMQGAIFQVEAVILIDYKCKYFCSNVLVSERVSKSFKSDSTDEVRQPKRRTQTYPQTLFTSPREQINFSMKSKASNLKPLSKFINLLLKTHISYFTLDKFKKKDAYICMEPVPLSQANGMTSRKHQRHPKASHPSNWHDQ